MTEAWCALLDVLVLGLVAGLNLPQLRGQARIEERLGSGDSRRREP